MESLNGLLSAAFLILIAAAAAVTGSMIVLGLFILYQLYRYTETHGVGLLLLTALDVVVVGLTWHEYSLMRRHLPVD